MTNKTTQLLPVYNVTFTGVGVLSPARYTLTVVANGTGSAEAVAEAYARKHGMPGPYAACRIVWFRDGIHVEKVETTGMKAAVEVDDVPPPHMDCPDCGLGWSGIHDPRCSRYAKGEQQ